MVDSMQERTVNLQARMAEKNIDFALLCDPDMIYYVSGFWGFLGMTFGRPVIVAVPRAGSCTLVTPGLEADLARALTWIDDVRPWMDGVGEEWVALLRDLFGRHKPTTIGIELYKTPQVVIEWLRSEMVGARLQDISDIVAEMRMVKTPEEIEVMRQAGQVAIAMCEGGVQAIGEGVPEYEVALEVIAGGTRKAAELLSDEELKRLWSPMIYNHQVFMSGPNTSLTHGHPTTRRMQRGDSVYMCFCGMTNFKQFKLGFDREYFVGTVKNEYARMYEIALRGQEEALKAIRPGVPAEEPHKAANEVYREAGFEAGYRTGRGIGYSNLESPELKDGDRSPLKAGMTFAVDGGVTNPEYGARVGDSIVVTETGYEFLTPYPRDLRIL